MKNARPSLLKLAEGIIALPFTVLVLIPAIILLYFGHWLVTVPEYQMLFFFVGFMPALVGIFLAADTTKAFFKKGKGTPAPWEPPLRLVRTGLYARMRNPMITGAILVLLGESLIFNSATVLTWAVIFFVANHFYFMFSEEPRLEKRFGSEYVRYKNEVPRWIPRFRNEHAE